MSNQSQTACSKEEFLLRYHILPGPVVSWLSHMFLLLHAAAASEGTRQEAEIHLVTHTLPKKWNFLSVVLSKNLCPAAKCQPWGTSLVRSSFFGDLLPLAHACRVQSTETHCAVKLGALQKH